jgi:hypothetical protein
MRDRIRIRQEIQWLGRGVENEPILHSRSEGKGMGLGGGRVGWGQSLCVGILRGDDREIVR